MAKHFSSRKFTVNVKLFFSAYNWNVFFGTLDAKQGDKNAQDGVSRIGVLLEYPTTIGFQWGYLKNGPYTCTVSGGNGRVF